MRPNGNILSAFLPPFVRTSGLDWWDVRACLSAFSYSAELEIKDLEKTRGPGIAIAELFIGNGEK